LNIKAEWDRGLVTIQLESQEEVNLFATNFEKVVGTIVKVGFKMTALKRWGANK